ncbi:MAG TPA: leucyl aminopeptidase [Candidatus Dormibacteraeota bacterium]
MKFVRASAPAAAHADLLVLPVAEGMRASKAYAEIDSRLEGALARAEKRGFKGGFAATVVFDTMGRLPAERVALLGLGDAGVIDRTRLNHALEMGLRQSGSQLPQSLAIAWTAELGPQVDATALAGATVEGAILAAFTEATHKSGKAPRRTTVASVTLAGFPRVAAAALERSVVLAEETFEARGLVNLPALELYPEAFAAIARKRGRAAGLRVEVLDQHELKRRRYGALLAVGMSSSRPPRLVVLRHGGTRRGTAARPLLALVGKGVTFDTGGISIKPAAEMGYMKGDMGGAAAVLGALTAIARLGLDVDVVGVLCLAENMVSSTAMRPGDVVTSASGKTIEVTNTDAEGRMVMADGMHHAVKLGATHVLDIATLTGGQRIALGPVAAHVQGSDRGFTDRLARAADAAGERIWEMPCFPEYRSIIDSPIADLMNSTARDGMAITSGLFMREFAAGLPWIHVDMAAPSWNRVSAIREMPKGPSGFGVRILTNLAELMATGARRAGDRRSS